MQNKTLRIFSEATVIITGGASGIGRALAEELAKRGSRVVLADLQIELAEKKYVSSVYFHTLFLFTIVKHRGYSIQRNERDEGLEDFLKEVFSSYYSEFLLNFGLEQLMATLDL